MAFDIKRLKPDKNSRYKQGYFPDNMAKKYFGKTPIIYRSGLELKFMQRLELSDAVERWSSETVVIPYKMKQRKNGKMVDVVKNYNIDFTVFLKNQNKYIIEIKASSFVPLNEDQIRRNPEMYKNACKWKAAIAWAQNNGYTFKVITEKDLKGPVFK